MARSHLFNFVLASSWLSSALAMLFRVYSLRFNPPESPILFWLPYVGFIFVSALMVLTRDDSYPLFITLGMAWVLHSIDFIRQPEGFIWHTDPSHNLQIAARIVETGHLTYSTGFTTPITRTSSLYPGMELLMSSLSMITGIPLMVLYKFAFVTINILTLLSFYFLMKTVVKNQKTLNLSVFLYALCPRFHGFDSLGLHESLAIIFYPLILSVFFVNERDFDSRRILLVILSMSLVTVTHHFTVYMLVFQALTIVIGKYVLRKRVYRTQINMLLLLVIMMTAWLSFMASIFITLHGTVLVEVVTALFLPSEYPSPYGAPPYSPPVLEQTLIYGGVGLLLLTSVLGAITIGWRQREEYIKNTEGGPLIAWWALNVGLIALVRLLPWRALGRSAIRLRALEFAYFGAVLFSAIGIHRILNIGDRFQK